MNVTIHADPSAPEADYAAIVAPQTVRLQRRLPGPSERVWDYLADSDLRRQWLAAGDMAGGEGSNFELVWRNDELTDPPGNKPEGFGGEHRMRSTITAFDPPHRRSEEHTSELQSLMRISYAVFCLKKKKRHKSKRTAYDDKHD